MDEDAVKPALDSIPNGRARLAEPHRLVDQLALLGSRWAALLDAQYREGGE